MSTSLFAMTHPWLYSILAFLGALTFLLVNAVVLILMLRKVLGRLQVRYGPNEVGPGGIFQTLCDVVKMITKEEIFPDAADKPLLKYSAYLIFVPALMTYMVIPWGPQIVILDSEYGLLFLFGISTLVPIGFMGISWASNNKYSLIGGLRAIGSQITYEVPLLLSLIPIAMMTGTLNLYDIVVSQHSLWNIIPQFPAFVIFVIAGLIEMSHIPFDMSEAENELIGGWSTETSSMRFGLVYVAEFSNSLILSAAIVTIFLGGWQTGIGAIDTSWFAPVVFMIKTYLCIFCLQVVRGTTSRVRIDQLLVLGWKYLLPASLIWIVVTGVALQVIRSIGGAV